MTIHQEHRAQVCPITLIPVSELSRISTASKNFPVGYYACKRDQEVTRERKARTRQTAEQKAVIRKARDQRKKIENAKL